jgi:hypothetical protein
MIHAHSLGRGVRYYPDRIAFCNGGRRLTFLQLYDHSADRGQIQRLESEFIPGGLRNPVI